MNPPMSDDSRFPDYASAVLVAGVRGIIWFVAIGALIGQISPNKTHIRTTAVAFLYASTELLRTISIGVIGVSERLFADLALDHRLVAGGITGLTIFALGAVVTNSSKEYQLQLKQLLVARSERLATIERLDTELVYQRKAVLEEIRSKVQSTLKAVMRDLMQQGTNADSQVAAQALVDLSNQAIRPLSHALQSKVPTLPKIVDDPPTPRIDLRNLLNRATTVAPFRPGLIALLSLALLAGSLLVGGEERVIALWLLGALTIYVIALALSREFLMPVLGNVRSVFLRATAISITFAAAATSSLSLMILMIRSSLPGEAAVNEQIASTSFSIYIIILSVILNWLLALYGAQNQMRIETLDLLKEQTVNLQWQRSRAISSIWLDQQNLSQSIHGEVQGQLIAEAMRIQRSIEQGVPLKTVLKGVERSLQDTLARLGKAQPGGTIESHFSDLRAIWAGNVELELVVSQSDIERLSLDIQCVSLVCSFMDEFTLNAVKHGKANSATFTLSFPEPRLLRVMGWNNGLPLPARIENGMGLSTLQGQAVSMTWSASTDVGAWICLEFAYKAEESSTISG